LLFVVVAAVGCPWDPTIHMIHLIRLVFAALPFGGRGPRAEESFCESNANVKKDECVCDTFFAALRKPTGWCQVWFGFPLTNTIDLAYSKERSVAT